MAVLVQASCGGGGLCVWSCNQSGQRAGLPARSSSVHAQCLALFFWVWVAKEPQCDCWQKRPFLPRQARVSRGGQLWAEPTLQPVPGSVVTWVPWSRLGGYTCPFLLHLSLLLDGRAAGFPAFLSCALKQETFAYRLPMPDQGPVLTQLARSSEWLINAVSTVSLSSRRSRIRSAFPRHHIPNS